MGVGGREEEGEEDHVEEEEESVLRSRSSGFGIGWLSA